MSHLFYKKIKLGNSGLDASRIALGTMELGNIENHHWHLNEEKGIQYVKYSVMQNHYNLLYHEDEIEMIPLSKDMNIGLKPYSSLA